MVATSPPRFMSARQGAGGLVARSARRQPWGWPALLLSLGLHGAVVAAALWITYGSQGNSGVEGEALVDEDAASMPVPVLRTQPQEVSFKITPKPTKSLRTSNLKRLTAKTDDAELMLAKWDMAPSKPIEAPPAPAAQPAPTPAPTVTKAVPAAKPVAAVDKPGQGKGTKTQRKASGQGSRPSSGGAGSMSWTSRIVSSIAPVLPRQAANDPTIRGTTRVEVKLKPDGRVADCTVWESSGFDLLDAAALRCVRRWLFTAPEKADDSVIVWVKF